MTSRSKCCNPFKKKNHSCYRRNLTFFSEKRDKKFSALFGLHVCALCKIQLYSRKDSLQLENITNPRPKPSIEREEEMALNSRSNSDNEKDEDYVCVRIDDEIKRKKIAAAIEKAVTA